MATLFDFLTVACFFCVAIAFFLLTDREVGTLLRLSLSGIAFAVANQVGNGGWPVLAFTLVAAGAGYAVLVVKGSYSAHGRR